MKIVLEIWPLIQICKMRIHSNTHPNFGPARGVWHNYESRKSAKPLPVKGWWGGRLSNNDSDVHYNRASHNALTETLNRHFV